MSPITFPKELNALFERSVATSCHSGIERLFSWDCYPTYFGSEVAYGEGGMALSAIPMRNFEEVREGLRIFAGELSRFASEEPDRRFVVYVVDNSATSKANPVSGLLSEFLSTDECVQILSEACARPNVVFACDSFQDEQSYHANYFKSDHHWRISGAVQAYGSIGDILSFPHLGSTSYRRVNGPPFAGSYARTSLCLTRDEPADISLDFGQMSLGVKSGQNGNSHRSYEVASDPEKHWMFYDLYYEYYPVIQGCGKGEPYWFPTPTATR